MRQSMREAEDYQALLTRFRQHASRCRALMDRHVEAALAATGDNINRAVPILGKLVSSDAELARELEAANKLTVLLGWVPASRPPRNPKERNSKGRRRTNG